MNIIDLTTPNFENLNDFTAVGLRKLGAQLGIKGASKGKKAELLDQILPMQRAQIEAKAAQSQPAPAAPKKGICEDCGRRVGKSGHSTLCTACYDYAGWENTHNDGGHDSEGADVEETADCPLCHPELDPRSPKGDRKSRAGMVIVAKGTEIHKSATFKAAAEAMGWTVVIDTQDYEDGDETNTRHYATATKGTDSISLAWDGRAYDYPNSSAQIGGKSRKVRNLKEALRIL